jgi:hypothetical protein
MNTSASWSRLGAAGCADNRAIAGGWSGCASRCYWHAALQQAGADWWECRSPNAAVWALAQSGVPFNMIVHSNGTVQTGRQPELAPWEVPRRDPAEPRPAAPELTQQRRSRQQRWRQRQRARKAAKLAAERDGTADADVAA